MGKNMNCDICGKSTSNKNKICDGCTRIMDKVIKEVGSDVLRNIDDCKYIYPMIKRVAEGSLRTQDVINSLLKGESD
jgi:disulfide oxidoreductase YuzD